MTTPKVLLYVQYLQGVGHLYRAAAISKAMIAAGLDVHVVSGGVPVPGPDFGQANIHQLTPIKCRDGDFRDLITKDGRSLDAAIMRRRCQHLLGIFDKISPDTIIIETFPFGRRQMRFELMPLLNACRSRAHQPQVICSVRDILQISDKPGRAKEIVATLKNNFNRVLIHGDPLFVPLEETFPMVSQIAGMIEYTGIVADAADNVMPRGEGEVLISAGGGATQSGILLNAAIKAFAVSSLRHHHWRLMAGPNLAQDEFDHLVASAPDGMTVERNRPDFKTLLANCAVSVSQAGYNTVADILQARCPAVLVPYAAKGETEQTHRAEKLRTLGRVEVIHQHELTPATLASAIEAAPDRRNDSIVDIDLSGAATSAARIAGWLEES